MSGVAHAAPKRLHVGSLTLYRCGDGSGGWCGSLPRRLDPTRPNGPHIGIGFRWVPASGRRDGRPPLVAVEGGPGYPSIGSIVEYTGIYGPLLRSRDLLLVDNRGTGRSALIDCKRLQGFTGVTSGPAFPGIVAGCARHIERTYRTPGIDSLDAANLFATRYATDDMAAILRRLRLGKVDLYGDSYGTYFVQSFISRHQRLLNSVVLDSSYPVRDLDPWYASSGEVARRAMDAVCARDLGCSTEAGGGSATERLARLVELVRASPLTGTTRDADGSRIRARVDVRALVDIVQDAASDPVVYRELDASVRAALAGDSAPLLRLVGQSQTWSHGTSPPEYFSDGLYMAVSCQDYPQLFSMASSPAERRVQFAAAVEQAPDAFSPFTPAEWLTMSAYSEPYQACLEWPSPVHDAPVVPAQPRPLPASIPILAIGGDLDSLTPLSDAQAFVPTLGEKARVVTLPNTVHVTSEGDTYLSAGAACARRIIRGFVRSPASVGSLDASCAGAIPPIHTPGAYPATLAAATPATLVTGTDPGEAARRAVTVAAGALADATIRRYYSGVGSGPGLRGGSFTAKGDDRVLFRLRGVRYVADATVDGTGAYDPATGRVRGELVVRAADGQPVTVALAWDQRSRLADAAVGGATLTLPAP